MSEVCNLTCEKLDIKINRQISQVFLAMVLGVMITSILYIAGIFLGIVFKIENNYVFKIVRSFGESVGPMVSAVFAVGLLGWVIGLG